MGRGNWAKDQENIIYLVYNKVKELNLESFEMFKCLSACFEMSTEIADDHQIIGYEMDLSRCDRNCSKKLQC